MSIRFIRLITVMIAVISFVTLALTSPAQAATGKMYLSPESVNVAQNSEISLELRIDPGTPIMGVQAEISYDAGKLNIISMSDNGTAFPYVIEENVTGYPMSLTRAISTGETVDKDSLIVTIKFKAVASSGSTSVTIVGNAQSDLGNTTDPVTQGATINFIPASVGQGSTPSAGGSSPVAPKPSQNNSQNSPGSSNTPVSKPNTGIIDHSNPNAPALAIGTTDKKLSIPLKWLIGGLVSLIVVMGIILYVRKRRSDFDFSTGYDPIDANFRIIPNGPEQTPRPSGQNPLAHIQAVKNPEPGSTIPPMSKKEE